MAVVTVDPIDPWIRGPGVRRDSSHAYEHIDQLAHELLP